MIAALLAAADTAGDAALTVVREVTYAAVFVSGAGTGVYIAVRTFRYVRNLKDHPE
jgi:spore maturation protein SpmB